MKCYRSAALLLVGMVAILILGVALPRTASSLARQQGAPTDQNSIFLPMVAQGGDPATNDGQDDTGDNNDPDEGSISSNWAIPHEYLILWQSSPADASASAIQKPAQQTSSMRKQTWTLNYDILNLSGLVNSGMEASADAILESYKAESGVELVEPNYVYTSTIVSPALLNQTFVPNDPRQEEQYAWELIDGYEAWDVTLGDASTIIAVVDTGVDLDHPDLVNKIVGGFDFVDRDSQADDGNGHGTHVAGTAAASTDNLLDGAGTCPNCSIMPIRALNDQGSGSLGDIAQGITFAANNGADVINLSLGARASSAILERAVSQAFENGVFVTCAAGNDNSSQQSFPAGFDDCLSVASVTQNDQRSFFSNFGPTVEVAAPGSAILSTSPGGQVIALDGTSMAAPHVAGLAGLLSSLGLTNQQISDRLCETADQITGTGQFWKCGRINMLAAVSPNDVGEEPTPTPQPTATPTATPSPTTAPTTEPTLTPNPYWTNPIVDGGFENAPVADSGWSYSDPAIRSTVRPASGRYSAGLGGENSSTDLVEQTVTLPANGRLSYAWIASGTYGNTGNVRPGDRLVLEIALQDGSSATFTLQHPPRQQKWNSASVDLSEFAGKSVTVRFRVETGADSTEGSVPTTFFVDDVTLSAGS